MTNFQITDLFDAHRPLIGMLHAPALPGSPHFAGDFDFIREHVLRDVQALVAGGAHGLLLENFGDVPFFPERVPAHAVAYMTSLANDVRRQCNLPLGINVLRNDGCSALAVAHAAGADFIRVNVLCGARITDQGIVQGIAHDLLRLRTLLGAERIRIFADVNVKHSAPLAARPIGEEVSEMINRGGADAIIVSGSGTGTAVDLQELQQAHAAACGAPVLIGSGVDESSIVEQSSYADGFIVGTSVKLGGVVTNSVDVSRVAALVGKSI